MVETENKPKPVSDEITITINFSDGSQFLQPLPLDESDTAQDFMNWFNDPGKNKVFSLHNVTESKINMFHHAHITSVDIEGYIEPEGRSSRWYERLIDRLRVRRL